MVEAPGLARISKKGWPQYRTQARHLTKFPGRKRPHLAPAECQIWLSLGGNTRSAPKGRQQMGETGFCKNVRFSAVSCENLRFPAVFLRKSATPKSLDLQSEPKISENLQKSAKMCVPGPVSPFCCLPFGAPWNTKLGNASLFTKCVFTIFVPLDPPPSPNQQSDGFPLEFLVKGPQTELRTLHQNCEQTLQKLRTNRIMNKGAFLKNQHKQYFGIVLGRGGGHNCLCVVFFLNEKETHKQNRKWNIKKTPA